MTAAEKAYTQMMGEEEGKDKYYNEIFSGKDPLTLSDMAARGKATGDMELYARASQRANATMIQQAFNDLDQRYKYNINPNSVGEMAGAVRRARESEAIGSGRAYRSSTGQIIYKALDANSPEIKWGQKFS